MISTKVTIPQSLLKKLDRKPYEDTLKEVVDKTGVDALNKVQEYGTGVSGGYEPEGGAPHWLGIVSVPGHYSGYLSDEHHIKHIDSYNVQIVATAEFADGVINGYSTNWIDKKTGNMLRFPPNPYHKRAVDTLIAEGSIKHRWMGAREGRL